MTATEVMKQLEKMGSEQQRKTYARHGCTAPIFGVKIGDLKTIVKKIKGDTPLAKELYRTGNGDAMYLAGMIANGSEMTPKDLDDWARQASWHMISGATVPSVAAEHPEGWQVAMKWIDSPEEGISVAGWTTLGFLVGMKDDADLDLPAVETLLERIEKEIRTAPNRTRYAMNSFVIAVGGYVKPLTKRALAAAQKTTGVGVDMGDTACKLPAPADYIKKMIAKSNYKKRKSAKC